MENITKPALQLFYESQTYAYLHDKSTYFYGDLNVADEFIREMEYGGCNV